MVINEVKKQAFKRQLRLMGNQFEITVVDHDAIIAEQHIDAAVNEIRRIEALLTTFRDDSQTALVNAAAGVAPVAVAPEMFYLVQRSLKISALTQGAFDITYGSIDKRFWNFDVNMTELPDRDTARQSVRKINWKNVLLDETNHSIFLKEAGMRIGFGGIGKGYAADRAKLVLQQRGVTAGVVNASGDLVTWGMQADGKPWTVGIASPGQRNLPFSYLNISNMAIATSGNYEKYAVVDGKKYSHTIDPRTGFPVTGIQSVTVISPSAELADALATPVMVMGCQVGLDLINQMRGIACVIIDDQNRLYTSQNINIRK